MAQQRRILEGKPQKQLKNKAGAAAPTVGLPTEKPWEAAGRPGAYDPHERLKDMDIDQVDAEVLYANATGGAEFYSLDADACLAAFQATNDAAIEFASVDPSRLIPVYILPLHDIECALKEVQRIANEGARAVQLPLYPSDIDLAPYWDEVYDPLWSAIEDLGIPISQHTGANEYLFELMDRDPTPAKGIFQSLPSMYMAEAMASWLLPGHLRAPPAPAGRVRRGRARLAAVLPHPARPHVRPPRLGAARHEPARAAEPLLAPEHVRHVRRGRVRRGQPPARSASRTCSGRPTTRTPTARGRSRSR